MNNQLLHVPVDELMPDPNQPRRMFLQGEIDRLAASIAARGLLQPLRVARDQQRECWKIVCGESRWRAGKLAGMATLPCLPVDGELSETDILSDQIIENHCRHDLRPLDLARAMVKLKRLKKCTAQELAAELGIGGASVSRAEALLTLPEDIQAMVDDGRLAESTAYLLSRLKDEELMRETAVSAVAGKKTREQVAEIVQVSIGKKKVTPKAGKISGKLEGVTFSFSAGRLTPESLLKAIEGIRAKLLELKKSGKQDVSALAASPSPRPANGPASDVRTMERLA